MSVYALTTLLVLVVTALLLGWITERYRKAVKTSRFTSRQPIPVNDLVAMHFAADSNSIDALVHWWKRAASLLGIDPRLLRPSDRFDRELAPVTGFPVEDELGQLDGLIEELCQGQQQNEIPKLGTFGECVLYLAGHARVNRAAPGSIPRSKSER